MGGEKRILRIRAIPANAEAAELAKCDVLFIAASEKAGAGRILAKLGTQPVITVADFDGFLEAGGMFNLILVENRVRWEINQAPIKASGLVCSSQLYRLAVRVMEAADHGRRNSAK
jgi:hypothetical protein